MSDTGPYSHVPIDRSNLVQCLGCGSFVTPTERLQRYKEKATCKRCGITLTPQNRVLTIKRGFLKRHLRECHECYLRYHMMRVKRNRIGELATRYPHIVRMDK
jgi:hypothetical protein